MFKLLSPKLRKSACTAINSVCVSLSLSLLLLAISRPAATDDPVPLFFLFLQSLLKHFLFPRSLSFSIQINSPLLIRQASRDSVQQQLSNKCHRNELTFARLDTSGDDNRVMVGW